MLQFICVYLLLMLIVIFSCKLIIDRNISLEILKKYPLGKYLYLVITKYISFWQDNASFWLYFVMFVLVIFTLASTLSIYQVIAAIKSL